MPGILSASWNADDSGIHDNSFSLTTTSRLFCFLNAAKSNDFDVPAVSGLTRFAMFFFIN
jgi:hypothetical protein